MGSAFEHQVGGADHYKSLKIQPAEFFHALQTPKLEGDAIQYLIRWRSKNGIEDLKKARHTIDLLIELEERALAKEPVKPTTKSKSTKLSKPVDDKLKPEKVVYLCGPIKDCDDDECKVWRDETKARLLELGVRSEDPMDRDMRGVQDFDAWALVAADKAAIDKSTHLIVHWTRQGTGSAMEIHYARERHRRIAFVNKVSGSISPWIKAHVDFITSDLEEAIKFVVDDSETVPALDVK